MMKKLILTTAIGYCAAASAAHADLKVMSWGGGYGKAQNEAYVKPFAQEFGINTSMIDADNPATPLIAQVEAGNVSVDVVSVTYADAVRLCDEGLVEIIDPATLAPAPDGTPAAEDFLPGSLTECGVSTDIWANIYAYDSARFPEEKPTTIADFFDTAKFPGKRGLAKSPKAVLEIALMADGVPANEVYDVLSTPEGVDRAFAKLDTIKSDIVWWEAGAQAPQLLADGEVVMTTAYNGRIFNAAVDENKPFEIVWDGQIYENGMFVIPKGAPNLEDAEKFLKFATSTEGLRRQAQWIAYGPPRKSAMAEDLLYHDGKTEMLPNVPTYPDNMKNSLASSMDFWVDHLAELSERFNAWMSAK
ncbi:putative spermidine/putrescine transport system substrate-binding protein [Paracoccus pantotrophus]|nr:putative spermidine/putrescine transport system substrate-binding protein [Paracoccus pantotrophus]